MKIFVTSILVLFISCTVSYGASNDLDIYIIGGSHPTLRDGLLYNTAYLFTPTGKVYTQDKLHITPAEREECEIEPGPGLKIFQTPFARIAIQICYDIEIPELSRLLTLAAVITLAVFLPMVSDMSGCSGNQAVAVSMRELSFGLVGPGELL